MDTPQLTASLLTASIEALCADGVDAAIGPASDGGYWAIGLRSGDPEVFAAVPMSEDETGARQRERLDELELSHVELEQLRDIDTIDDAEAVSAVNPWTRCAAALRRLKAERA